MREQRHSARGTAHTGQSMKRVVTTLCFISSLPAAGIVKPLETKKPTVEKSILCDNLNPQLVKVETSKLTLLNFPLPPKEVIPGGGGFDFRKIKNDLSIKSLRPGARTNVAVYLTERRCSFELVTVGAGGDQILIVRDPKDEQFEVKFYDK